MLEKPIKSILVTTGEALRREIAAWKQQERAIGLVPTMGAVHEGHLSLVDASCSRQDVTIVTVYVNPTQFNVGKDLDTYPRDLEADLAMLGQHGAQLVFAPTDSEMYRSGHDTYVEVGSVAQPLEGAVRPGHFRGVATIVLKLFNLVMPDAAYFGQKDYQQTLVVRQLVRDFDLPIEICVCPIVRDEDGLAMSSRNAHLSAEQRRSALSLSRSLTLAAAMVDGGERDATRIESAVRKELEQAGVEVDYVALVKDGTVTPVSHVEGPTLLAVAGKVGKTRLLDNRVIW